MKAIALILGMVAASSAVARDVQTATGADGSTVSVEALAATSTPYRNQSILYTIRCAVRGGISEISLSDISIGNAIVQRQGKPDVHDEVEHGVPVRVASFRYIVTPLQAGKLIIPAVTLSGKFEAPDLSAAANPLGLKLSSGVKQAFSFFSVNGAEPFSVTSNAVQLNVKPPAAAMDPWLPLASLKIIEDADAQHTIHVGEPLARKVTLLADGAVGSQIPQPQPDETIFKTYVDSTTTGEDVDIKSGSILGWRKESYSLIPQKAGRLVLPGIRVSWWDIVKKKRATAELPGRVITVLPVAPAHAARPAVHAASPPPKPFDSTQILAKVRRTLLLLGGFVALVLIFPALWLLRARRRVDRASDGAGVGAVRRTPKISRSARVSMRALDDVGSAEELKAFLQAYAQDQFGTSRNAALETIFAVIPLPSGAPERADVGIVIRGLSAALYAGKDAGIEDFKERIGRILLASRHSRGSRRRLGEMLPGLNPG